MVSFFQSKYLPRLGTLQDGGVRANNSIGIAQEECRRIWPLARTHDLLITVGTGYVPSTAKENKDDQRPRKFLFNHALLRLWRAYNSSPCMDGMEAYREGQAHVPYSLRSNTIHLDYALDSDLSRLDNVERLAELAKLPFTVPDELVRAILATCFFFELDELPTRACGQYQCRGSILCARQHAGQIIDRVLIEFPGARFQTARGHLLGRVDDYEGCAVCGYYRNQVTFSVPSLDEDVSIVLTSSTFQRQIGGFPNTIQQFLHNQQADAVFERSDHQVHCWPPRRMCYCSRAIKQRVQFVEPAPERKKRRL